ncbi:transposase [Pendulispora brunnea]|uniref:Transposase n=1 Tax=Pendulispora brunnea TaxID=2905690 RepID=A0ABZ2KIM5_9BACT
MSDARTEHSPRGRYTRGYLPHFDHRDVIQAVTFRLVDSLPEGLGGLGIDVNEFEHELNRGHGSCVLRDPEIAQLVIDALRYFDGDRYFLGPWVIMPNHVHVLVRPLADHSLGEILHSWKSFTAKKIRALIGGTGAVWQREYFDRMIRNERHLLAATRYVHENPVAAGLVLRAMDWPFSSVGEPAMQGMWWSRARLGVGRPEAGGPPARCRRSMRQ